MQIYIRPQIFLRICCLITLLFIIAVTPVSAADGTVINLGDTVYIGGSGLNLTHVLNGAVSGGIADLDKTPGNFTLGWWPSLASVSTTSPAITTDTSATYNNYQVTAAIFRGYTGKWYLLKDDAVTAQTGSANVDPVAVFNVQELPTTTTSSSSGIVRPITTPTTIVTLPPRPGADFSGTPTSGMAPLIVTFTDLSTNNPTSWYWSFGDQTMSTDRNPIHRYSSPGTYSVSLAATNSGGSDTKLKTYYVTVNKVAQTVPIADFTGTPTSGNAAPLKVTFTDLSTNNPIAWKWNFGDGDTTNSQLQNPVHTYKNPGKYTVSLTVTSPMGSNTRTTPDYISIRGVAPIVTGISPLEGDNTKTVTNSITGSGFSSGATVKLIRDGFADIPATGVNVDTSTNKISCSFNLKNAAPGKWNVVVTNPDGQSATARDYFLTYDIDPVADFEATYTSGKTPFTVQFTDKSKGTGINSWVWQYRTDVNSPWTRFSLAKSPSYTFTSPGSYDIGLLVEGTEGSDLIIKSNFIHAGCDFSKEDKIERCFGAVGDQCLGVHVGWVPLYTTTIKNEETCTIVKTASIGSILHDNCCVNNPGGKNCDVTKDLNAGVGCEGEWQEAWDNYLCPGRQWNQLFGPYFFGNTGDLGKGLIRAPSGQKVNPKFENLCASGKCKRDNNGIFQSWPRDICGEYCVCE